MTARTPQEKNLRSRTVLINTPPSTRNKFPQVSIGLFTSNLEQARFDTMADEITSHDPQNKGVFGSGSSSTENLNHDLHYISSPGSEILSNRSSASETVSNNSSNGTTDSDSRKIASLAVFAALKGKEPVGVFLSKKYLLFRRLRPGETEEVILHTLMLSNQKRTNWICNEANRVEKKRKSLKMRLLQKI